MSAYGVGMRIVTGPVVDGYRAAVVLDFNGESATVYEGPPTPTEESAAVSAFRLWALSVKSILVNEEGDSAALDVDSLPAGSTLEYDPSDDPAAAILRADAAVERHNHYAACPGAANHGNPFRYCPVEGCGWMETPEDVSGG